MCRAQSFIRKLVVDGGAIDLLLPALAAHQAEEPVQLQLLHAVRLLLPSAQPKPFVMNGGLELRGEAVRTHPHSPAVVPIVCKSLQMLSSLNNHVRRGVLMMALLPTISSLVEEIFAEDAADPHGEGGDLTDSCVGLMAQLARGDLQCRRDLAAQAEISTVVSLLARRESEPMTLANGARILAGMMVDEAATMSFVGGGAMELLCEAHATHSEAVQEEVTAAFEQAIFILCEAAEEPPPDEELEVADMGVLLRKLHDEAAEKARLAAEEEARIKEEEAAVARREEEERARAEAEAQSTREALERAKTESVPLEASSYDTAFGGGGGGAASDSDDECVIESQPPPNPNPTRGPSSFDNLPPPEEEPRFVEVDDDALD